MTIPTSPTDITPGSITDLIRTVHPEATVGAIEVVAAHVFGEGDVSTAGRIEIEIREVRGADLPRRLVVKVARPDLPATPLYANEVAVYTHLRGELELETPRCFGARFDPRSGRFALALEDLTLRQVTFGNVLVEVSLESVRSILAQVATLHAATWDSDRFDADLSWVQPHTSGELHTLFTHPGLVPAMIRAQIDEQPFKAEIVASIGQDADSLQEQVRRAQAHQATLPTSVVHGDLHVGNTYYLPDGTGGVLDWQLASRGRFIHDVGYYLITALPADVRRAHERELLAFYLDQLAATGVAPPDLDAAWEEYRASVAWCLYIGWLTTPVDNYGWSVNIVNHIRLATAYRDLATAAAIADLPT
ncbi:MAG TPA: phosphotransferase [Acidimicrobiales bacterium]|nr:phosphotransferase [Acidimicrobiales bacterium]